MITALLLSGGIDSIAIAAWQHPEIAFTVDYGQSSARGEIRAAQHVAETLGITHEVLSVDCSSLGSGDLLNKPASAIAPVSEWWPFRNQMLTTLSAMRAVALGVSRILVGSVASDGLHCDGTSEFYRQLDALLVLQEGGIRVEAPAIAMTTTELVRISGVPLSLLAWAHSCHTSDYACGSCRGCNKHRDVMLALTSEAY
ncbi:MAG: 7-cyano-7-deazaguanine synthase [Chthoniobacterales bacterium]